MSVNLKSKIFNLKSKTFNDYNFWQNLPLVNDSAKIYNKFLTASRSRLAVKTKNLLNLIKEMV